MHGCSERKMYPERFDVVSLLNGDHLSLQTTMHPYSYMHHRPLRTGTECSLDDRQVCQVPTKYPAY